jgi:hypothetical protein
MYRTFGQELLSFARAAGTVKEQDFQAIREVVQDYLTANFGLSKVTYLLEAITEGQRGLKPQWDEEDAYGAYPVRTDEGGANGQNAFCLLTGRPLWIVGAGEGLLAEEEQYVDLWDGAEGIPPFQRLEREEEFELGGEKARMLIVIPLRRAKRTYGVLSCEAADIYTPNDAAKEELQAIAEALSILHEHTRQRLYSDANTSRAIKELTRVADEPIEFKTKKPKLFLAYGVRKDSEVLATVRDALEPYSDAISIVDWETVRPPGDITDWIATEILEAKYLVSYLSEVVGEGNGESRYADNSNVIFETGMFHALRETAGTASREWLPIREGSHEETPFDFRTMQMIAVPRDSGQKLRADRFRAELDAALRELLASEL